MHPSLTLSSAVCCFNLLLVLQRATCGNMRPVSKANVMFACPEFTEFDPARSAVFPPRPDSCCKVGAAEHQQRPAALLFGPKRPAALLFGPRTVLASAPAWG